MSVVCKTILVQVKQAKKDRFRIANDMFVTKKNLFMFSVQVHRKKELVFFFKCLSKDQLRKQQQFGHSVQSP